MPNWVANRLKVIGDKNKVQEFLTHIKGQERESEVIDFNTIVPMPVSLRDTESSTRVSTAVLYYLEQTQNDELLSKVKNFLPTLPFPYFEKETESELQELYSLGEKYVKIFEETGYLSWYEWSIDNWGTKWNATSSYTINLYDNEVDVLFDTAWSGVPELIDRLVASFPHLYFEYDFADEDFCYNTGSGSGCGNEDGFTFWYHDSQTKEAFKTYIYAHALDEQEFIKENAEWLEELEWFKNSGLI